MSGLHSNSTYVQQKMRSHLLGSQTRRALADVVIPSFREDAIDEGPSDGPDVQPYLSRLPAEPYIMFVGALRPIKGITVLLEAYGRLTSPPPLVLIGTVDHDTPRAFPAGVTVIESAPHRAVMAAWERCLFGVAPSVWPEPFGNVVHEAMSKGKAVIGSMPGGQTDMISGGENGLLVGGGDVDALVAAMRRLIDDAGLRERLGHAARERAAQFTAQAVLPRFQQLYQQLVNRQTGVSIESDTIPLVQR
jgi:glycosyltransferase involved in cell wall biosynthesis